MNVVDWSRAQFALTACYHWLFVPLTLGLGIIIGVMETIYYRTRDEKWLATTKFWMTLFGVNFAIGVATGIILEFEFGTNWSNYSWFVGDIFGAPLSLAGRRCRPSSTLPQHGSPPWARASRHCGFLLPTRGCSTLWAAPSTPRPCATR